MLWILGPYFCSGSRYEYETSDRGARDMSERLIYSNRWFRRFGNLFYMCIHILSHSNLRFIRNLIEIDLQKINKYQYRKINKNEMIMAVRVFCAGWSKSCLTL